MSSVAEQVQAVRAHAIEHYTEGWDVIVEAYTDEEIAAELTDVSTCGEAIAVIAEVVGILDERARDIRATAF